MTASKDGIGVSMSRRHVMMASMVGGLAGAAGLAHAAGPARASDSMKGHGVQWEQPEIFNATVIDFIRVNAVR